MLHLKHDYRQNFQLFTHRSPAPPAQPAKSPAIKQDYREAQAFNLEIYFESRTCNALMQHAPEQPEACWLWLERLAAVLCSGAVRAMRC